MKLRSQRALRISCFAYFALVAATLLVGRFEAEALPPALRSWEAANPLPAVYSLVGSLMLLGAIAGTGGLLLQKGWAAYVHLASTAVWIAIGFSAGPAVSAGLSAPLLCGTFVVSGLIYGLAFFTDALAPTED